MDDRDHLDWIRSLVSELDSVNENPVSPEWDSKESYISAQLVRAASNFANLTGPEKRDVFLYLLGNVVNRTD
jgi:hypothetical protein